MALEYNTGILLSIAQPVISIWQERWTRQLASCKKQSTVGMRGTLQKTLDTYWVGCMSAYTLLLRHPRLKQVMQMAAQIFPNGLTSQSNSTLKFFCVSKE